MYRKIFIVGILLVAFSGAVHAQTDTILNRYKYYLLNSVDTEGDMMQFATSLNSNHQWDDINYQDTEKANWKPLIHLKRLRDLALVWSNPKSSFYHNETIWKAINGGLNHWFEKRYKSSNWWHNEIGVPQHARDIIILLRNDLSSEALSKAMKVLAQHRVQTNGVGANLTWSADLGFHYAALINDKALMQKCLDLMLKEIRITTEEGVQPDFSFHQHGKRLQMYQYGKAFLWENARLAWQVKGTEFAFPENKVKILTGFVLNGWQWMARGIHTVPGTMDRSTSRIDALHGADMRKLLPYLMELSPEERSQFIAMEMIQKEKASLKGFRYYPYSDFAAYHQKDYSFFLKTISPRTLATESINNENLKGYLLNSGDAYLIKDGNEYFNLMPVWDWMHLPGVTAFDSAFRIDKKPFTGSVSDGRSGLTVMEYQMEDKAKLENLSARKFWASHKDITVCLIADLTTKNLNTPVYTTLDQSRLSGKVTVNGNIVQEGEHQLNNVQWIHHGNFAYIPLNPSDIRLKIAEVSGSWSSINKSLSSETVADKIFMPVMQHQTTGSTGYVLSLSESAKHAQKVVKKPVWEVVKNDKDCQAVCFKDGTIMAAFYVAGNLKFKREQLSVDKPCLVLISKDEVSVSNPAHTEMDVNLNWAGKIIPVKLKADGSSTTVKL